MPLVEVSLEKLSENNWCGRITSNFSRGSEFKAVTLAEAVDLILLAEAAHKPPAPAALPSTPLPAAIPMPRRRPVRLAGGAIVPGAPIGKATAAQMRADADEAILKSVSVETRSAITAAKAEARGRMRRPAA